VRIKPALAIAVAGILALSVGAAALDAIWSSGQGSASAPQGQLEPLLGERAPLQGERASKAPPALYSDDTQLSASGQSSTSDRRGVALPPGRRLQRYDVSMRIRVADRDALSGKTKRAMRTARLLGGYVVSVHYATPDDGQGDSSLVLRVPIVHIQEAIQRFSGLGEIVAQQISLQDLQGQADRLTKRIDADRARIAALRAKQQRVGLTYEEQAELQNLTAELARLTSRQAALVREGTFAKVSLDLTTRESAPSAAAPGRFDRFLDNSGDILGKEGIALLYALVVAGPFILLLALALLGERARRRRSDRRLLEETA
jgi:hypothetical protein